MRKLIILVINVILLCGSIALLGVSLESQAYSLRGYTDPFSDTTLPYRVHRFGVNADLTQYSESELLNHLALMETMEVKWVRQFIYWDKIQPKSEQFEWEVYDTIFKSFNQYDQLSPIVVFMNTPDWAREDTSGITAPPSHLADFSRFLTEFVKRYGSNIRYYQIWDEPNLQSAWGNLPPKPIQYIALLQTAYQTIHNYDSDAIVISASLAPTVELTEKNINDWYYFNELYALGLPKYADVLGAKAYGFDTSPQDRDVLLEKLNFSRIIRLRETMLQYGDSEKSLWITNWGWNSLPYDWSGEKSIWGQVSQQQQTTFTLEAFERADIEWPWLGGMILHHWQPNVPKESAEWGFSLLNPDNTFTTLGKALHLKPFTEELPQNGLYHPTTPSAKYSGLWSFSELGADIGWLETSDSSLLFEFYGKNIGLLLRQGNFVSFLYPKVNEKPANHLPKDNQGNSYIFLRSASLTSEISPVKISENLPLQANTLSIVADRGWDRWVIAGFIVSTTSPALVYQQQVTISVIVIFFVTIALMVNLYDSRKNISIVVLRYFKKHSLTKSVQWLVAIISSFVLLISAFITWQDGYVNIFKREAVQWGIAIVLSGGLVALEIPVLGIVVGTIVLWWCIYNHLEIGLALIIFWSPFFLFPVELYRFAIPMSEWLILLTFSAWGIKKIVHKIIDEKQIKTFHLHKLDFLLLAWVVLAGISTLWSSYRAQALTELRVLFIEPFLFYIVFRTSVQNTRQLTLMVKSIVLSSLLVSTIGLFYYISGDWFITAEGGIRRLASVYGSPNNVALLVSRTLPFILSYAILESKSNYRLIAWGISFLLIVTLFLTQSVGGIIFGFLFSIALISILIYGRRGVYLSLLFGVLGASGLLILAQISARFSKLFTLSEGTNFLRLRVWESGINIIQDNPLTGLGLDQFLYYFRSIYVRPDAIWDMDLSHPHNIILDVWIRLGILGVILLTMIIISWWNTWSASKPIPMTSPTIRAIWVGCGSSFIVLLAYGLIDNSIFVVDLSVIFIMLISVTIHLAQRNYSLSSSQDVVDSSEIHGHNL